MIKTKAIAVLKSGIKFPIKYIDNYGGYNYDFTIDIDGEEVDFMYYGNSSNPDRKWLERDLEADEKNHCDGHYKEARFAFDRIEINTIIGEEIED